MKTIVKSILIALFTITLFSSCEKEPIGQIQSGNDAKYIEPPQTDANIVVGLWVVSYFDNGILTKPTAFSYLDGYVLQFNRANVVIGTKEGKSIAGKWAYVSTNNGRSLAISFVSHPLTLMNNQWYTVKQNSTEIVYTAKRNNGPVFMTLSKYTQDVFD